MLDSSFSDISAMTVRWCIAEMACAPFEMPWVFWMMYWAVSLARKSYWPAISCCVSVGAAVPTRIVTSRPASRKKPFSLATTTSPSRPKTPKPVRYLTLSVGLVCAVGLSLLDEHAATATAIAGPSASTLRRDTEPNRVRGVPAGGAALLSVGCTSDWADMRLPPQVSVTDRTWRVGGRRRTRLFAGCRSDGPRYETTVAPLGRGAPDLHGPLRFPAYPDEPRVAGIAGQYLDSSK